MDRSSVILLSGLGAVYFFDVLFVVTVYLHLEILTDIVLLALIFVTIASFSIQPSHAGKILLLVASSFALPMISAPNDNPPGFLLSALIEYAQVSTDRVQFSIIPVSILSWLLFMNALYHAALKKKYIVVFNTLAFYGLLYSVTLAHDFEGASVWQVIIDISLLTGAIGVFLFFRFAGNALDHSELPKNTSLVVKVFVFIIIFDVLASLANVTSWVRSYRDGVQGLLYGFELPYSFVVGIAVIGAFTLFTRKSVKTFVMLTGSSILSMTNISSALGSLLFALLATNNLGAIRIGHRLIYFVSIVLLVVLAFYFDSILEVSSSLWVRAGTYIATVSLLIDGGWIAGIMPGFLDFTAPSNLGAGIHGNDYVSSLMTVHENISRELIERAGYSEGGAFIPHNAGLALVAGYGVLMLVPAIYYLIYMPFRGIRCALSYNRSADLLVSRLFLFNVLFSHLHPFFVPAFLVFCAEYVRLRLDTLRTR